MRNTVCWCSSDNAAKWKEVELTQIRVPPQARLREKQLRTQEEDNITVAETLAVCIEILRRWKLEEDRPLLLWPSGTSLFRSG